jgi:hypothetical protein
MDIPLIFLTSLSAAVLANRLARRGPLTIGDIAGGMLAGGLGVGIAQILGAEGGSQLGLPLLIAFSFPLGLQSFHRPAPR